MMTIKPVKNITTLQPTNLKKQCAELQKSKLFKKGFLVGYFS